MEPSLQLLQGMVTQSQHYPASNIDDEGLSLLQDLLIWLIGKVGQGGIPRLLDLLGSPLSIRYSIIYPNWGIANVQGAMIVIASDLIDDILSDANIHGVANVSEQDIVKKLVNSYVWRVFLPYLHNMYGTLS